MLTLFHHPLSPASRYVRLILTEYGVPVRLIEERFWDRREEFLRLTPAGRCSRTPTPERRMSASTSSGFLPRGMTDDSVRITRSVRGPNGAFGASRATLRRSE